MKRRFDRRFDMASVGQQAGDPVFTRRMLVQIEPEAPKRLSLAVQH